jgi:hypothetical protein
MTTKAQDAEEFPLCDTKGLLRDPARILKLLPTITPRVEQPASSTMRSGCLRAFSPQWVGRNHGSQGRIESHSPRRTVRLVDDAFRLSAGFQPAMGW